MSKQTRSWEKREKWGPESVSSKTPPRPQGRGQLLFRKITGCLCQLNPRRSNPYTITNEDTTRESRKDWDQEIGPFTIAIFEWRYSEVNDQNTGQTPLHVKIEITHYGEMNDKIFDMDIDMNVWDSARNVIESISFHRFHGQRNSTIDLVGPYLIDWFVFVIHRLGPIVLLCA
jgi:hypothetical protein